ncbi:MAG: hypothetical protein JO013_04125 [Alphaproteobacteria bacterium]|nr:hypothetical protein [Alphaproteobacteria bacterium]
MDRAWSWPLPLLLAATATAAAAPADRGTGSACAARDGEMLKLPPRTFDQDDTAGWRSVASRQECTKAAADLIRRYRTANGYALKPADLGNPRRAWSWATTLAMHEGQLRANLGQYRAAKALFRLAQHESASGWNLYIEATIAFLDRDLGRLRALRSRYASIPVPPDYAYLDEGGTLRKGRPTVWPDNIEVIDGLIACFHKPYVTAYGSDACRQAGRRLHLRP